MSERLADITVAIQEWVVSRLTDSADLADALGIDTEDVAARIWDSPPPPDADLPYIDVMVTEPRDVGALGLIQVMASALVTVKVVGREESYEPLRPVAVAIHAALQGRTGDQVSGGGAVLSSDRLRAVAYPEVTEGVEYRHLGGTYAVNAQ